MVLTPGGEFHTHRGAIAHDTVIGLPEGSVVKSANGDPFLVLRPLLDRLRAVDAARRAGDLPQGRRADRPRGRHLPRCPGARGRRRVGGADVLAAACRRAGGPGGVLRACATTTPSTRRATSRRSSASIRRTGNCVIADVADYDGPEVDRAVLDMLAPWDVLEAVATHWCAGGVLIVYVATVTQLSHTVEAMREQQCWTEPRAWESLQRGWHVVGLAVRPQHTMRGHTAFLISARQLAPGPSRRRRCAARSRSSRRRCAVVRAARESNSISGRAATRRSAASSTSTTCAAVARHHGHADAGAAVQLLGSGLGRGNAESPVQFGNHRPHGRPLLLERMDITEQKVELQPADPHTSMVTGHGGGDVAVAPSPKSSSRSAVLRVSCQLSRTG